MIYNKCNLGTMTDPFIISLVIFAGIILIVFLIKRNRKDGDDLKKQLQDDYKKHKEEENDIDTEEKLH